MAKNPKLPNGYGSVKKLSGNRTNPYGVYPPVTEWDDKGGPIQPPALAFVDTWLKGVGVLNLYHAGNYTPGMELPEHLTSAKQKDVLQGILSDFNASKRAKATEPPKTTFKELYEAYFRWKFVDDKTKTYSVSAVRSDKAAFKNFKPLHEKSFCELVHSDFQDCIDNSELGYSSRSNMVLTIRGMSQYAKIYKLTQTDESEYVKVKIVNEPEYGFPFEDEDLEVLWSNKNDPTAEMLLIMCYSGYRITAYKDMEVSFDEQYFRGGVKNRTSKNRVVPIHSGIQSLVASRIKRDGCLLRSDVAFRKDMDELLPQLGIERRTPHDCRHTFSRLCEDFEVKENDRKRMLGHSFGSDITNKVYGHRNIEKLRTEIEKIKICH